MKMPSLRKLSKTKAEKKILTLVAVHRREETAAEEISEECGFCGNKGGNWRDGGGHVISRLALIGKVSAIITHISGKVWTLNVKRALHICSCMNIQDQAKSYQAGVRLPNSQSLNNH